MSTTANSEFKIQAYRMKEIRMMYGVTWETWKVWIKKIPDLGDYKGKAYTPAQVEIIITHLGKP